MKAFALWVIYTVATTGQVEINPMDMTFPHSTDCEYAATYYNANIHRWPREAEIAPFYYCQPMGQEGTL